LLAMWLAPLIGILAGILAQWLIIRATTTDPKLRAKVILKIIVGWILLIAVAIAGPNIVVSLKNHYHWNDRELFVVMAGFWWCYAMVLQTISIIGFAGLLGTSQRQEEARSTPPAMAPGTMATVVIGVHLMLFSWLVRLAWLASDVMVAGTIAAMMVALGVAAYVNTRGRTGAALARACNAHVTVCGALILAIFNLRFDVWAASGYGVSVVEVHQRVPIWIIPLLSLVFVAWGGAVLAVVRAKPRLRQQ